MKLLLHTCCAPCLEYPYQVLKGENIDFTGYFYNPNIQPDWEYQRRKNTLMEFLKENPVPFIFSDPVSDLPLLGSPSFEAVWEHFPDGERCVNCYRIRLEKTAQYAAENGYDSFSSTLMGSIYQNHELLCNIGEEMASKYHVHFYDRDYRDGFYIGQNKAKEQGLYRQKFCGCICSLNESKFKEKILASAPKG